jgi:MoaA/NifB/PqqE/SkfB family radical SAM enzyme/polysaccharide pyruvyl transferase WcaK-like protein
MKVLKKIKIPFPDRKLLKKGLQIARNDFRVNRLGQLFPLYPTVLNLLVNDICNSRCQMCMVWKQKKDKEFSPGELELILTDPLFEDLEYIGVSGGEPTLRQDLPEIFRVIAGKQSLRRGTGIITNAILEDRAIQQIEASASVCRSRGVRFNVMVSLDGIGKIHDTIRGREGNYQSALEVIRYFTHQTDIPITIGCTVTTDNVWHVDEVFDFCKREGITGRFRVAEFIDRLHNQHETRAIRNFSDQERCHLGLFFAKVERAEPGKSQRRRTYRNIRKMLLDGEGRTVRCHWQSTAVTLDCRGSLFYCAPHSPMLGDCLETSARKIYLKNIGKRRSILKNHCSHCIHDYGSTETLREWLEMEKEKYWRERFSNERAAALAPVKRIEQTVYPAKRSPVKFMIIGWYGTETAGDKAILAEIVHRLQKKYPGCHITLASIQPYYSRWTLRELSLENIRIIPTFSRQCWKQVTKADEVIMGGGPLMHIRALGAVAAIFKRAKRLGKKTRIAGCGIGPLDRGKKFEKIVRNILELADEIELRDSQSVEWAVKQTGRTDIACVGDYAEGFVRRWLDRQQCLSPSPPTTKPFIHLYLREWTNEYKGTLDKKRFEEVKCNFEEHLGQWLHEYCLQQRLGVRLLPMHHFVIGNDDRDFNREFAKNRLTGLETIVETRPLPVQEILASMREAALCVCMRFHSVLFAETLGVPFIAIDYTHGGKISRYLADCNKYDWMYTLKEIAEGKKICNRSQS